MRVEKAAGALGAYITQAPLELAGEQAGQSKALFGEVEQALNEHGVLFFRDQQISPADLAGFAKGFGAVESHPAYPTVSGSPDVQILESTPAVPTKIEAWHTDMTFRPKPPAITLLHAQVVPRFGGDTLWASATAAYEALSQPLQGLIDGLTAVHDFRRGFKESLAEPGGAERLAAAVAQNPPVEHPVVRLHPVTGRKAIYVNPLFTSAIVGLTAHESRGLLDILWRQVVMAEFTVRLRWRPNTVAIWDNRATQHKPVNDFVGQHRRMHRVTIADN
jgi:taurine dioxygenase